MDNFLSLAILYPAFDDLNLCQRRIVRIFGAPGGQIWVEAQSALHSKFTMAVNAHHTEKAVIDFSLGMSAYTNNSKKGRSR